jgi:predicted MFS family arabinose efflux permease
VPLLARTVLHLGPEGFGFLMTALGVGAVSGALAVGARANPEPGLGLLLGTAAVACASLVGLSTVRHAWAAVPMLFVTGFAGIITVTGSNTIIQLGSPDELRGRVMSLYTWVYGGAFPFGSFLVGAISERHGVSAALLFNGSLGLGLLLLLAATRPWRRPPVSRRLTPEPVAPRQQAGRRSTARSIRRGTSRPSPGAPSSRPRSAITRPRRSVVTGQPDTAQPSQGL